MSWDDHVCIWWALNARTWSQIGVGAFPLKSSCPKHFDENRWIGDLSQTKRGWWIWWLCWTCPKFNSSHRSILVWNKQTFFEWNESKLIVWSSSSLTSFQFYREQTIDWRWVWRLHISNKFSTFCSTFCSRLFRKKRLFKYNEG